MREIKLLQKAYPKAKHLLTPYWKQMNESSGIPSIGFCYIAAEALFHMLGGKNSGYQPMVASYNGDTHWWLEKDGIRLDPTACQFGNENPPYHLGRKVGFLTGYDKPSKRCKKLMEIIQTT